MAQLSLSSVELNRREYSILKDISYDSMLPVLKFGANPYVPHSEDHIQDHVRKILICEKVLLNIEMIVNIRLVRLKIGLGIII